ncbi:MAG: hypothetical protein Ct9H300mP1_36610 [Planctomycetaceae bacterium]|nr:MAG: hypothetical protein Ct9H300mP1_36610 [Planctomycetaceae bacterium]
MLALTQKNPFDQPHRPHLDPATLPKRVVPEANRPRVHEADRPKPGTQGDVKSGFLGPLEQLPGHPGCQQVPQDTLGPPGHPGAVDSPAPRDITPGVQQRTTDLQTVSHRGAVDLHPQIIGDVVGHIEGRSLRERIRINPSKKIADQLHRGFVGT